LKRSYFKYENLPFPILSVWSRIRGGYHLRFPQKVDKSGYLNKKCQDSKQGNKTEYGKNFNEIL
jgi:hypothetical protein